MIDSKPTAKVRNSLRARARCRDVATWSRRNGMGFYLVAVVTVGMLGAYWAGRSPGATKK
ncbi:hypothetical protein [Kutzneria sp. 744]|uniref:hypothetical protein n=1 Tax=Kutzneria sp. (strain 744) TaxID=345341 RepID=UPI0004AD5429|nr:hypothetical protein [Kutzneria sp. 744]